MFSSEHVIWKVAYWAGELDDWLPYAEELVTKWGSQSEDSIVFPTTWEIIVAALLLQDNLLPASARAAFAKLMLKTLHEADESKLTINCLHVRPPKPGRKENRTALFIRMHEVRELLQQGKTATDAYHIVAEKHFRSPDTIRRDYERHVLKRKKPTVTRGNH